MKRVLKWVVPVDDQAHPIGSGPIVHLSHQGNVNEVVVWTEEDADRTPVAVMARVYGTGHPYPDNGRAVGTVSHLAGTTPHPMSGANLLMGNLVWHLVVLP